MKINLVRVLVIGVLCVAVGYIIGLNNRKIETKIEEKIVEKVQIVEVEKIVKVKETSKTDKSNKTKETIKKPDGTVIVKESESKETIDITKEVDEKVKEKLAEIAKERSLSENKVVSPDNRAHVSLQLGFERDGLGLDSLNKNFVYGVQVEYNVWNGLYAGAWVKAQQEKGLKDFGFSLGVDL